MTSANKAHPLLALALGSAVFTGILVAWTPRSWRIAVAMSALTIVAGLWAVIAPGFYFSRQMILVALIGLWGFLQLGLHTSVAPYLTVHGAVLWAMCAITFFLGSQISNDYGSRAVFLTLLSWGSTALALLAMLQFYTAPARVFWIFPAEDSVLGTFHYRNQFAAFMVLVAPIALWRISRGAWFQVRHALPPCWRQR
jgi:hypothetical protein